MSEHPFPNSATPARWGADPLSAHAEAFARCLSNRGYAAWTTGYALRMLAALGVWLHHEGVEAADLDERTLEAFLCERYRTHCPHRDDRAVLALVVAFLRESGMVISKLDSPSLDESAALREAFRGHLTGQCNLAPSTVRTYLDTVERFLDWRFGAGALALATLCAEDVTGFMLEQARRYSAGHTQLIASGLRGFLRFLLQSGRIGADLGRYVPTPPRRQLAGLPKFMPAEDVERLLRCADRDDPHGRRDYAILMLLARLGLRAGEVAALRLEDLDWDAGELIVRGKAGRAERLPLPWEVGEAISRYLSEARPRCDERQVFLCLRAPRRGFRNGNAVGTIVRRALVRAGLHPAHWGAHLLRHSLATRLLREGASLLEIGELLRHRGLDTTRIYAKVDARTLGTLALPWPGGKA